MNFETLLTDRQNTKETDLNQTNPTYCGEKPNDLLASSIKNQYHTIEKLINTDQQCEFRTGERFRPLPDNELEPELHQRCTKFELKDIKTILGKSFHVHQTVSYLCHDT